MSKTAYETVMGLEVHVELDTLSKIYCGCTTEFGGEENTHCCPVCTGMPGVLPALNEKVVEFAMRAGIALNCDINRYCRQDRKHYFYPDLPKNFQTSQYDLPICLGGYIDIDADGEKKRIALTRIHFEEDAGKLNHDRSGTRIDYNRCGVPLIEIVTEPDFRTSEQVRVFLETLRSILLYTGVSNCKMQEGSLRCDVNLSVRPFGQKELGTRTEMKNLNSFSAAVRAILYEQARQIKVIEKGGRITQDTLRWDDARGLNYAMRTKEDADEYLYFPEPDIMPVVISDEWYARVKNSLCELPPARRDRYVKELGLPEYDAAQITASKHMADFFEACVVLGSKPKTVANFIMGDISRLLNERGLESESLPVEAKAFFELIALIESGIISHTIGVKVLEVLFDENKPPKLIIEERGWAQVSDENAILSIVEKVIAANEKAVADYRAGKEKALTSLVGQVMKESRGKANPAIVNKLLIDKLAQTN